LADNLLFILILNSFPEHVRTHIFFETVAGGSPLNFN